MGLGYFGDPSRNKDQMRINVQQDGCVLSPEYSITRIRLNAKQRSRYHFFFLVRASLRADMALLTPSSTISSELSQSSSMLALMSRCWLHRSMPTSSSRYTWQRRKCFLLASQSSRSWAFSSASFLVLAYRRSFCLQGARKSQIGVMRLLGVMGCSPPLQSVFMAGQQLSGRAATHKYAGWLQFSKNSGFHKNYQIYRVKVLGKGGAGEGRDAEARARGRGYVGYQCIQIGENIFLFTIRSMSFLVPQQTIQQFIPNYVVRSDFLPTRVNDGNSAQVSQVLRLYEEEKRRGRVSTQRPIEFNPNRYASFRAYETVRVNQPLDEQHFSRIVRR